MELSRDHSFFTPQGSYQHSDIDWLGANIISLNHQYTCSYHDYLLAMFHTKDFLAIEMEGKNCGAGKKLTQVH